MAEPKTLKLKEPIQFGSETITELRFRAPKAKDLRPLPAEGPKTQGDSIDLAGRLCGQPSVVMDELGLEDLAEVSSIIEAFMPSGPATGGTPSR